MWNEIVAGLVTIISAYIGLVWKHKNNLAQLESKREQIKKESEADIIPQLTEQLKQVFNKQSTDQSGRISRLEQKLENNESENLELVKQKTRLEVRIEELEKKLTLSNKENTLLRGQIKELKFENAELSKRAKACEGCERYG